jgi:hypothetical protein
VPEPPKSAKTGVDRVRTTTTPNRVDENLAILTSDFLLFVFSQNSHATSFRVRKSIRKNLLWQIFPQTPFCTGFSSLFDQVSRTNDISNKCFVSTDHESVRMVCQDHINSTNSLFLGFTMNQMVSMVIHH